MLHQLVQYSDFHSVEELQLMHLNIIKRLKDYFSLDQLPTIYDLMAHNNLQKNDFVPLNSAYLSSFKNSYILAKDYASKACTYFNNGIPDGINHLYQSVHHFKKSISICMRAIMQDLAPKKKQDSSNHIMYRTYQLLSYSLHCLAILCNRFSGNRYSEQALLYNAIELDVRVAFQCNYNAADDYTEKTLLHMGRIYHKKNQFDDAIIYYHHALIMVESHQVVKDTPKNNILIFIATLYHDWMSSLLSSVDSALESDDIEQAENIMIEIEKKSKSAWEAFNSISELETHSQALLNELVDDAVKIHMLKQKIKELKDQDAEFMRNIASIMTVSELTNDTSRVNSDEEKFSEVSSFIADSEPLDDARTLSFDHLDAQWYLSSPTSNDENMPLNGQMNRAVSSTEALALQQDSCDDRPTFKENQHKKKMMTDPCYQGLFGLIPLKQITSAPEREVIVLHPNPRQR